MSLDELVTQLPPFILFQIPPGNTWNKGRDAGLWVAALADEDHPADSPYLCASTYFIDTSFRGYTGDSPQSALQALYNDTPGLTKI